ncbi:hypothetical protein [Actinoplanes subglobosus]|uniref:Holin n=1 Tax=Actinoplanes subglobosus TaxID=1547892 RepID=A0ABV8ITQ9_9ACTN
MTGTYIAGVWLLMSQFPELTPNEVVKIVSVPFATVGVGAGTAWTGRTIHQAYVRRRDSKAV